MMLILNVVYVLVAIAIIAMVLMQRGSGAAAGSGFGAGASGTVFGSRGASNFLSKSTKWLAVVFFGISLFMAWQATHNARPAQQQNLGVMSQLPAAPAPAAGELPSSTVPSAPVQAPAGDTSTVPAAPAATPPVELDTAQPPSATPAEQPAAPPQGG
ncbi:preprotein translocase subunit SecG [Pseudoxanthomonas wuyuanensis]|uniref:Protein-export membrane protein SecG n=1 Tax=Pseudoxanthomonas wuyuanensis TaxID=1073196 RepID=A0A286D963_9GAMM|nr:preprotein translocase subunit SecG [Pseudoxanthomonas wuyuanensis]KAF1722076.1 preprotein translocase subunit SecG [Pseudoxanthomonas wuyuanensis]SOD55180.1 protein translocase subunit secG [Pseudoxanthomonas wuyuanensis]